MNSPSLDYGYTRSCFRKNFSTIRCRLFQFYPLTIDDVLHGMRLALDAGRSLQRVGVIVDDAAIRHIVRVANGDLSLGAG